MNCLLLSALLLGAAPAQETVRYPAKPAPREFLLDEAKLLKPEDAAEIKTLCEEALTKKRAPIIVVTVPSLAAYGAGSWPIERYAMNLMSEWGVGSEDWNYGMLLLVSPGDRKARIELGGKWERQKDDEASRIMSQRVIPKFKQGDYSKGILEGVKGLHDLALDVVPARPRRMAPTTSQPPPPSAAPGPFPIPNVNPSQGCLPVGGCGLVVLLVAGVAIFSLISRMFRGGVHSWGNNGPGSYGGGGYYNQGGGFGSGFGGGLLGGALGSMVYDSFSHRGGASSGGSSAPSSPPPSSSGDSDSSFGGGSFGGGFSGGGGSTGEW